MNIDARKADTLTISRRAVIAGSLGVVACGSWAAHVCAQARAIFTPEQFGGGARRGLDNGTPLRRAFAAAAAAGGDVLLGGGEYEVSSEALLRQGAIQRPSGVSLIGAGTDATTIRVSGRSVINQLFDASGASSVETRAMRLVGNRVRDDSAPGAGAVMSAILAPDARGPMRDIRFVDCEFDGFASSAWLLFENQSARYEVRGIGTSGCRWISRPGTAPRPGDITVHGYFVYVQGYSGPIRDVLVDDPLMQAQHVKGGVALVGNVDGGTINVGTLADAGQGLADAPSGSDGMGSAAVMLYAKPAGAPRNIAVTIERLSAPYSSGIYSAGAYGNRYTIGVATGQRDTRDATLFKGIVAIQQGHDLDIKIGRVEDSNRVLMVSIDGGQNLGSRARDARISADLGTVISRPGAVDVTIDAGGSPIAGGVRVVGLRQGAASTGVHLRAGPGVVLSGIDLSGLTSTGAREPVRMGPGRIDAATFLRPR